MDTTEAREELESRARHARELAGRHPDSPFAVKGARANGFALAFDDLSQDIARERWAEDGRTNVLLHEAGLRDLDAPKTDPVDFGAARDKIERALVSD